MGVQKTAGHLTWALEDGHKQGTGNVEGFLGSLAERQSVVMVICMPGIFYANIPHSGGGCRAYGWLAGSRV